MAEERYYGHPANPADRVCEFCDESATEFHVLKAWTQWIYTCPAHFHEGCDAVRKGRSTVRRPRRVKQKSASSIPARRQHE